MSLALNDTLLRFDDLGARLGGQVRARKDVMAQAADKAVRLAARATWPRVVGAAALGFAVGVVVLGGRRAAMQAATGLAGDWLAALKADHRLVDGLFGLLEQTEQEETGRRNLLFARIAYALAKHQFEEEHVVYPTLIEEGPAGKPRRLDAEHFEMKRFVHELSELPKDDPKWLKKAQALRRLIQSHVREEEEEVFPRLRERLSHKQNRRLARELRREGMKLA